MGPEILHFRLAPLGLDGAGPQTSFCVARSSKGHSLFFWTQHKPSRLLCILRRGKPLPIIMELEFSISTA